jgi:hypothetical protein
MFYHARYYAPYLNRWIQPDTIVPNPADPQDFNRYAYARNSPFVYVDPSGHWYYDPGTDALVHTDTSYNEWQRNLFYINTAESPLDTPSKAACEILSGTSSPCRTEVIGGLGRQILAIGAAVVWEPADWVLTANDWRQGNFSWWDLLGLLPLVPSQIDNVGDALRAADNVGDGVRRIPLGFKNVDEFTEFGTRLSSGLGDAGYGGVQVIFQGSSVTGVKFKTGVAFDVGRVSDFDIALASPDLLQRAKELGIELRSRGTRTGPLQPQDLIKLGLHDLARAQWTCRQRGKFHDLRSC